MPSFLTGYYGGTITFLWIILAHWIADFVLQTNWQASNKSKSSVALTCHVSVYTVTMVLLVFWTIPGGPGTSEGSARLYLFAAITFGAHFITDAITSRITSRLFRGQLDTEGVIWSGTGIPVSMLRRDFNLHYFFVVVGFDQFLHYAQLFITLAYVSR